jgi:membrane protease YdiL (CAAX protease family)
VFILTRIQKAVTFYAIALGAALVVALVMPDTSDGGLVVTMMTPLVAVLVMLLVVTPDGRSKAGWAALGLHRAGLRLWPVAVAVPAAVVTISYLLAAAFGLTELSGDASFAWASLPFAIVLGLGEEIGWRGYMLPLLADRRYASAAVGVLHGIWHLPLMIFTTSYNTAGSRWITIPVMLGVFAGAGVFYGYLRLAAASTWPVVLAHQSFNSVSEWFASKAGADAGDAMAYAVGETGVITLVLVAIVAGVLLSRRSEPAAAPERAV